MEPKKRALCRGKESYCVLWEGHPGPCLPTPPCCEEHVIGKSLREPCGPPAVLPKIHPLDQHLAAFVAAMRAKFEDRANKHPGKSSVTHPDFDWESGLKEEDIQGHLDQEIREWLAAFFAGNDAEEAKEAVDLANMAFLDWVRLQGK